MMSIERQRRILEVLDLALEAPAEERGALLAEHCGGDSELVAEVEKLIQVEEPGGLLDAPVFDVHGDPGLGRRIGDYELVEILGRGGMGTVFLAHRESFEQRVAIKIIRRGLDLDPVLVRRFENERAILARLDHPGIARLLDGGTTGDGLPYVVMEHVEGEPIDSYCRNRGLDIRQRLELFCRVLDAVQYAHRHLIVHRDLKPGNILVADDGAVKLLDFGIAKLLDDELAASPLLTVTGESPMTPRYASPEQLRRQPISTASDVYVLGVLLFELLTDLKAYDVEGSDPGALTQAVCEKEAERPSTAVKRRLGDLPQPAVKRLRRRLSGDLDGIVLKAMRKEPAERYSSVERLAEDIRRHLGGHTVRALRGTWSYRTGKFIRRHKIGLSLAALFAFFVGWSFFFFIEAKRADHRAERFTKFTIGVLGQEEDDNKKKVSRSDVIAREERRIRAGDLDSSEVVARIELLQLMAMSWRRTGRDELAKEAMGASHRWAVEAYGPKDFTSQKSLSNFVAVLSELEEYDEAAERYGELVGGIEDTGGSPGLIFRTRSNWATTLNFLGSFEEAEAIHRDVLQQREDRYLPEYGLHDTDIATSRHNLASVLYASGELESALESASQALISREHAWKDYERLRISATQNLLGKILTALGRVREAADPLEEALDDRSRRFGEFDHRTAESQRLLGEVLIGFDDERAELLLAEALATYKRRRVDTWRREDVESVLTLLRARQGRLENTDGVQASYERLADVRGQCSTVTRRALERWREIERLLPDGLAAKVPDDTQACGERVGPGFDFPPPSFPESQSTSGELSEGD